LLPPALALCPDLARGENQMSTSTDNNANFLIKGDHISDELDDPP